MASPLCRFLSMGLLYQTAADKRSSALRRYRTSGSSVSPYKKRGDKPLSAFSAPTCGRVHQLFQLPLAVGSTNFLYFYTTITRPFVNVRPGTHGKAAKSAPPMALPNEPAPRITVRIPRTARARGTEVSAPLPPRGRRRTSAAPSRRRCRCWKAARGRGRRIP